MGNPAVTKQTIIEKSAMLFNKKGYAGTTLQDLTTATRLTKGSIYGNFTNKNEVALEAFRYNFAQLGARINAYVSKETGAISRLFALTRFYRQDFDMMTYLGGCPLMNAATDSDDTNEALRREVAQAFESVIGIISGIIDQGKQSGEISNQVVAPTYGALFFSLLEGGILLGKTTGKKQYLYEACDRIDKIIQDELQP